MKPLNDRLLLPIVLLAFVLRAVAGWQLRSATFWSEGYVFFFRLAQGIASGDGIASLAGRRRPFVSHFTLLSSPY